ncbi:MAG: hypothetical protein PHW96_03575 [Candidatus Nanoarchaeia archaeon]|nr:hypothetical protein [Candidatus Nanoarchaeia archaeon]
MNNKGQFFVLGMIIGLVVIVSIINAITIPYEFSVSLTENERLALEKYDIMKNYLESAVKHLSEKWNYFSLNHKIEYTINSNCEIEAEKPWSLSFNIDSDTDKNSLRIIGENGELKSQVYWENISSASGKVYFYDSIGDTSKTYSLYYNVPEPESSSLNRKAEYTGINYYKNSTAFIVETDYYYAVVDLTKNGVISSVISTLSGKKLFSDSFNVYNNAYQSSGGTATLLSESYGPVFVNIRTRSSEFGVDRAVVINEYLFFNDRIISRINATYRDESTEIEIKISPACSSSYNVSLGDGTLYSGWCDGGDVDEEGYTEEQSYITLYGDEDAVSILTDYSKWNAEYYFYSIKTIPSEIITFKSNSTSMQEYSSEILMVFHTPKNSRTYSYNDFVIERCSEIITNSTLHKISSDMERANNYILSENTAKGFGGSLGSSLHAINPEVNAMQSDWYGHGINSQNFTITETAGAQRTNFLVKISISSNLDEFPDMVIPQNTLRDSIGLYYSNQKISSDIEWTDADTRTGEISFLVNMSAYEEKNYELRYY